MAGAESPSFVDMLDHAAAEAYKEGINSHNKQIGHAKMQESQDLDTIATIFSDSSPTAVALMVKLLDHPSLYGPDAEINLSSKPERETTELAWPEVLPVGAPRLLRVLHATYAPNADRTDFRNPTWEDVALEAYSDFIESGRYTPRELRSAARGTARTFSRYLGPHSDTGHDIPSVVEFAERLIEETGIDPKILGRVPWEDTEYSTLAKLSDFYNSSVSASTEESTQETSRNTGTESASEKPFNDRRWTKIQEKTIYALFEMTGEGKLKYSTFADISRYVFANEILAAGENKEEIMRVVRAGTSRVADVRKAFLKLIARNQMDVTKFKEWFNSQEGFAGKTIEEALVMTDHLRDEERDRIKRAKRTSVASKSSVKYKPESPVISRPKRQKTQSKNKKTLDPTGTRSVTNPNVQIPKSSPVTRTEAEGDPQKAREILAERIGIIVGALTSNELKELLDGKKFDINGLLKFALGENAKKHYSQKPEALVGFDVTTITRVLRLTLRQLRAFQASGIDGVMPELADEFAKHKQNSPKITDAIARAERLIPGSELVDPGVTAVAQRVRQTETTLVDLSKSEHKGLSYTETRKGLRPHQNL